MRQSKSTDIIAELGFIDEIRRMRAIIDDWIGQASREIRPLLEWQFVARSKYFRPLTIFGCYRALSNDRIPDTIIRSAAVLEMMHNVTLIIDDIVDESDERFSDVGRRRARCSAVFRPSQAPWGG
jgi:geranylgeranyl diphosphate synthase type I